MNIAVVGSGGYIAGYLIKRFSKEPQIKSVLMIGKRKESDLVFDLEYPENFDYQKLKGIDYIIFTAAISAPDKCALDFDFCWKINVIGTSYFIRKALDYGCRVIFFLVTPSMERISGNVLMNFLKHVLIHLTVK